MHLGSLENTQGAKVAIGCAARLELLLRLFRTLQTSQVLIISTYAQLKHEVIVKHTSCTQTDNHFTAATKYSVKSCKTRITNEYNDELANVFDPDKPHSWGLARICGCHWFS